VRVQTNQNELGRHGCFILLGVCGSESELFHDSSSYALHDDGVPPQGRRGTFVILLLSIGIRAKILTSLESKPMRDASGMIDPRRQ